jgi:hypothetical protein
MAAYPKFEFDKLLAEFPDILASVNAATNDAMGPHAFAQLGFEIAAPTEQYAEEHAYFVDGRCEGELSDKSLADLGHVAATWRAFSCVCLGYLLGRYQTGDIDDAGFALGDAQSAGFIFANSPTLYELAARYADN